MNSLPIWICHFRSDIVSGAELAILDMIKQMGPRWEISMLVPGAGKLSEFYEQQGIATIPKRFQTPRRLFPGWHRFDSWRLARILKRAKVGCGICNTFPAVSRVGTAARLAGIPLAVYVREYIAASPLHARLLQSSTRVFAVSHDVKSHLSGFVDPRLIDVCQDYVDVNVIRDRLEKHRATKKRALPFETGVPVVGLIGRITRYKQQDLFIRALAIAMGRDPDLRAVLVGTCVDREQAYMDSLVALCAQLGVSDKIRFLGHRLDAVELVSELNILCLTSDREPFPRVILEAQVAGVPVIASCTGGCSEMIQDGVEGLLFNPIGSGSAELLAAAIVRLRQHPEHGRTLAAAGLRRVQDSFGSPMAVQNFEAALSNICQQPATA